MAQEVPARFHRRGVLKNGTCKYQVVDRFLDSISSRLYVPVHIPLGEKCVNKVDYVETHCVVHFGSC